MQLKQDQSSGGIATPGGFSTTSEASFTQHKRATPSLPLGQSIALSSISGPTYVTAQLLVQQVAYKLSDKIFSYSPETFDLDTAAQAWATEEETNIYGYTPSVVSLQTRAGAGALALGYIFSQDFDLKKRHIPQALVASSSSLPNLRAALDQLALLYRVSSPLVAHVAAADYQGQDGLVAEYGNALQIAEELGLGLVSSASAYDSQHMALFATLMAKLLPTLHVYDGVRTSRETVRVIDTLSEGSVEQVYKTVSKEAEAFNQRLDPAGKVIELLKSFNNELGTDYQPFEYHGHQAAETVLVVFGSVESQLVSQVITRLNAQGQKLGVVNVRVYRPFIEEAFLSVIPDSARRIAVLGQVADEVAVQDASLQSALFADALTAVTFSDKWESQPSVVDVKYAAADAATPASVYSIVSKLVGQSLEAEAGFGLESVLQYTFWDVDDSLAATSPTVVGNLLARDSSTNVCVHEVHDNLTQGGLVRTDIRVSKKTIEAPYAVEQADVAFVGEEKLLKELAVVQGMKKGGKLLLRLPTFKAEDAEKRIPPAVRQAIHEKGVQVFILDTSFSPALEKDAKTLVELSFYNILRPARSSMELVSQASGIADESLLAEAADALSQCVSQLEVPATWSELPADFTAPVLPQFIKPNSFVSFEKDQPEAAAQTNNWQSAAKGLTFKEAYGTTSSTRPDLAVKTFTVTVQENRRLTPLTYDRNIFHIEFDLGDSGLTYKIGEALGIHADNDPKLVQEFISSYGLDADELVQVPSRENPAVWETRTIYQSLMQNLDIMGKPPKRFFEALAEFATDESEKKKLAALGGQEGAEHFKQLSEVETVNYVDILEEFKSARPSFTDLVRIVSPLKRREYSIASAQAVTPKTVALMIVVVDWVDPKGRTRYGQASRYLSLLPVGTTVTVSVKPSVMKLPTRDDAPLIMAGLGTGLAPFRAFCQYRAMQKAQGKKIGAILLYLGSRHQREEYLYGEEWEAYLDAGVITLLGAAFSRDQPQKIYIQDRMRQTMDSIVQSYIQDEGSFYLCGPTWPVPDVTEVLEEAIKTEAKTSGRKVDARKEIERLKENGRYVLEVY